MTQAEATERLASSISSEEVGPCKFKLSIEIDGTTVDRKINDKYRELSNSVALPGFRKGKVPRQVLERKYGEDILKDLAGSLVGEAYEEALEDQKLVPVSEPDLNVEGLEVVAGTPLSFDVTVEVRPNFEIENYTGLPAERRAVEVTEDEINEQIEQVREQNAQLIPREDSDPIEDEDQVRGDLTVTIDGEEVQKQENATVFVNDKLSFFNRPAPQIKDALLGKKSGDTLELDLEVPEEASGEAEKFAGKTASFKLEIKGVKRLEKPELDEEFLKKLDMDDEEELREEVEKSIRRHKEREVDDEIERKLVDDLLEANNFALPEGVIEKSVADLAERRELDLLMARYQALVQEGKSGDDIDFEELRAEVKVEAAGEVDESRASVEKAMREHLVLDFIGTKEKIFVTESEIDARIEQMAQFYGKWPQELRKEFEAKGELPNLRRQMREEKVRGLLREKAEIKDAS